MAIKKQLKTNQDNFINSAPDAAAPLLNNESFEGVKRGNKRQITLTFAPEMIPRIDAAADALGISRAAWINMTISQAL